MKKYYVLNFDFSAAGEIFFYSLRCVYRFYIDFVRENTSLTGLEKNKNLKIPVTFN